VNSSGALHDRQHAESAATARARPLVERHVPHALEHDVLHVREVRAHVRDDGVRADDRVLGPVEREEREARGAGGEQRARVLRAREPEPRRRGREAARGTGPRAQLAVRDMREPLRRDECAAERGAHVEGHRRVCRCVSARRGRWGARLRAAAPSLMSCGRNPRTVGVLTAGVMGPMYGSALTQMSPASGTRAAQRSAATVDDRLLGAPVSSARERRHGDSPAGVKWLGKPEGGDDRLHVFGEPRGLVAGRGVGRAGAAVSAQIEADLHVQVSRCVGRESLFERTA
jgi:hypothetical protein